jgi:hypothetical protein
MWKLVCLGFLMCTGGIAVHAAEKADEGREIIHFFGNMHPSYSGNVTAVERDVGGTAKVRIRSEAYNLNDMGDGSQKISKEFLLHWTQTGVPVPFVPGMGLEFTAKSDGQVTAARYGGQPGFYRKRPDGLFEVLLCIGMDGHGARMPTAGIWIRAVPTRLNLNWNPEVGWSRQYGLVISSFHAEGGSNEGEQEALRRANKGLPVANVPGERIQIGRDGWKKMSDDIDHERSKGIVPPKQYIGIAKIGD